MFPQDKTDNKWQTEGVAVVKKNVEDLYRTEHNKEGWTQECKYVYIYNLPAVH